LSGKTGKGREKAGERQEESHKEIKIARNYRGEKVWGEKKALG